MTDKYKKFILRLPRHYRIKIMLAEQDIISNNLSEYDIKPLKLNKDLYRIRNLDYRIIYRKNKDNKNDIVAINKRWDIY